LTALGVIKLGHPALRIPSSPVTEVELATAEFQQFVDDLAETCIANNGVGIAAPQVGVNKRVIVVYVTGDHPRYPGRAPFPLTIVINPVVTNTSAAVTDEWEGDLSAIVRGIVPRAASCKVEGVDRHGNDVVFDLSDSFHARVFQHEIDHLDGVFFTDRVVRKETLAELPEWETYWQGSQPFGITPEWERVALMLMKLTHELSAWSSVVLIPKPNNEALHCAAHYRLPDDWAKLDNRLDSGSMNARAYVSQQEIVDNRGDVTSPPSDGEVSFHQVTASAVVLIPGIGTLEVLADRDGYSFEETQLQAMREAAASIANYVA
jgi:peptide deformylase